MIDFKKVKAEDNTEDIRYFSCPSIILNFSKRVTDLTKKLEKDIKRYSDGKEILGEFQIASKK